MSTFNSFDWDNNEEWKRYLDNILIPPGTDRVNALLKLKHKYYKRNIDPNHEIPEIITSTSSPQQQSSPTQTSSNTSNSSTTQRTTTSSTTTNTSRTSSQPVPPRTTTPPQPQRNAVPESGFFKILKNAWLISTGLVVIFGLAFLLSSNPQYYYRSFLAAFISYLIPLFHSFEGRSMNREMFNEVIKNENAQYLISCVMFYFLSGPMIIFLIPVFIFSFYHVLKYVNGAIRQPMIHKVCTFFSGKQTEAINMATTMEITNFILIVFGIFTGTSSIFLILAYYRLLKIRYQFSTRIQNKCHELSATYDYIINTRYIPNQLKPYLIKFKRFFSS